MGMTVTLDGKLHTRAVYSELGKEIALGDCSAPNSPGRDLSPIDLVAMGVASCLLLVMDKAARKRGIDLTGTWADTAYELQDYKIVSVSVAIHSSQIPSDADRTFLETESHECPVYLAIKDNVRVNVAFEWGANTDPSSKTRTQPPATQPAVCGAAHK